MRRLTTGGGTRGRHPKEEKEETSPDFYRLSEEHPLPESIPVPAPTPPAHYGSVSDVTVSNQFPFSGSRPQAPDLQCSQNLISGAGMSPTLLSRELEAARIHEKVNGRLGLYSSSDQNGLGVALPQMLYPPLSSSAYTSLCGLPSSRVGNAFDSLLSGGSIGLQQMLQAERQKEAAAEMARVTAMDNLLRLREASAVSCAVPRKF
eukprot:CAMPEP_0197465978 /NCGR_PEP_ID=MMETSP1175-20131217/64807_1 /TAXON_ID=1003142 /ORGANISM="Triceratium dubium, Strain CCMP147" /LENGTH=204 /DNA_ID=CAMNT_0043002007 /DNA_START=1763 /DNA_END=2377 /DNA_ORIENTATION=+